MKRAFFILLISLTAILGGFANSRAAEEDAETHRLLLEVISKLDNVLKNQEKLSVVIANQEKIMQMLISRKLR
jgi:hypothetical protein